MISEEQRARWRRWTESQELTDTSVENFATVRPLAIDKPARVRMVFVPGDPEVSFVRFDPGFWSWWKPERRDPVTNGPTRWGGIATPSSNVAIKTPYGLSTLPYTYTGLHRSGVLEIGLLKDAGWKTREGTDAFRMNMIVGRFMAAVSLFADVVERYQLKGPFLILVALRDTLGSILGGFAEGWAEPDSLDYESASCAEPNLLYRREIGSWPTTAEATTDLGIDLAGWLDDCWGVEQRRFIARRGDKAGQMDLKGYYWG